MTRDGLVRSTCATRSGLSFQCNMLVLLYFVSCRLLRVSNSTSEVYAFYELQGCANPNSPVQAKKRKSASYSCSQKEVFQRCI